VTIQVVPLASDVLMLLAAAVLLALAGAALVQLARRRRRAAVGMACAAAAIVAVYVSADLAVGLSSRPQRLAPGDFKCFDDWCATMKGAREDRAAGTLLLQVQIQNRGRGRAMRSSLARAYLEVAGGGRLSPRDGSGLLAILQPGQAADVTLAFAAPPNVRDARLVVVEGDGGLGPGTFEIGGEGSLLHARAGWSLPRSSSASGGETMLTTGQ
jgi:hypothetical protein